MFIEDQLNRWLNKENIYIEIMEYSSVIKRNEILSFATKQMKVETIRLREINQLQKDKYIYIYSIFCVN